MEKRVIDRVREIASQTIPMHMPGHKRSTERFDYLRSLSADLDMTEIPGLDNLNDPKEMFARSMERAAALWGSRRAYYLVNGSTGGILAAVTAAVPRGGTILMARNSHLSAYHACEIRGVRPVYLLPETDGDGLCGPIPPEAVHRALEENEGIDAVLITSPTYEGVLSDIAQIAGIVHSFGLPLIVDEAHGAHLGLTDGFPGGAIAGGADIVVHSLHKTLPSLTQTAVLHLCSDRVEERALRRAVGLYQTSSPSYLLSSSIDGCVRLLEEEKTELFADWRKRLDRFYTSAESLQHLRLLDSTGRDGSKLVILCGETELPGPELARRLREDWKIETEMSSLRYVLAMTGPGDTDESMDRLLDALFAIDGMLTEKASSPLPKMTLPPQIVRPSDAAERAGEEMTISDALGRVSLSYLWAYPPGVPLLVPGETVTEQVLSQARTLEAGGVSLSWENGKIFAES